MYVPSASFQTCQGIHNIHINIFISIVEFDPGCEAMVYTTSGVPLQGITGGSGGERRVEYIITPEQRAQGTFDLVIESSCNGLFGVPWGDMINPPDVSESRSKCRRSGTDVCRLPGLFYALVESLVQCNDSWYTLSVLLFRILTSSGILSSTPRTWWSQTWRPGVSCGTSAPSASFQTRCLAILRSRIRR
jgi:hypothetical protein